MHGKSNSIPEADRSIQPRLRDDVQRWLLFEHSRNGEAIYIYGSREMDRYVTVPGSKLNIVAAALSFFDGRHSIVWIEEHLRNTESRSIDVSRLYQQFSQNGLIADPPPPQLRKGDISRMSIPLFSIDVRKLFAALSRVDRLLFPWAMLVSFVAALTGLIISVTQHRLLALSLTTRLIDLISGPNLAGWLTLLLVSVVLHEMAHGVVACHYGVVPRRFEAGLYLGFIPMIFLRVGGLCTIDPPKRIKVWVAGIYWNFLFASFLLILWYTGLLAESYRHTAVKLAAVNVSIAVVNLFPFLPTDGYFILSTALRTFNIRQNAWKELGRWLRGEQHRLSGFLVVYVVLSCAGIAFILQRIFRIVSRMQDGVTAASVAQLVVVLVIGIFLVLNIGRRLAPNTKWKRYENHS
jgi:putative peptide zinc metalloprotease protein